MESNYDTFFGDILPAIKKVPDMSKIKLNYFWCYSPPRKKEVKSTRMSSYDLKQFCLFNKEVSHQT
jgi:hypothetical protein